MTTGFSQNNSRYLPDFFNQIEQGDYGQNSGNNSSYSPQSFGGSDPRNPGFRTNLGSLYGMQPNFQSSMGLQPTSYYGDNLSFYGSDGQSASPGSFGLGTGLGSLYFNAPSDINQSPSFTGAGTGQNADYGALENTIGSNFGYQAQYNDPLKNLSSTNARGGAAAGLITDNSGTSYGDSNYNMNKPGEYSYRQSNYTPFGMGLSTGSGNVSANIVSPNANDIVMDRTIGTQQGGYANQQIAQGQDSIGAQGGSIGLVKDPGIMGLLANAQAPQYNDFAQVGAKATNNATNDAQLRMQGNISSNLNAASNINALNTSPFFGNQVNAGVNLNTNSGVNLNTGDQGFAQGTASSNTTGTATSGMNQSTTLGTDLLGQPKYYTYKTPEGTLKITSDQNVAAQAASFNPVDINSPDYKNWVTKDIPNAIKEDFNTLKTAMPGVFGEFPDFDTYAAFQYAQLKPNAQAQVNQNTTGTVYNDLGQITTTGNQYANLLAGQNGNIAANLNAQGIGNATAIPNQTSLQTGANTQTNIAAAGDTFGIVDNSIGVQGSTANLDPKTRSNADINSSSNASSRGIINTSSNVSSATGPQNTGGMGGGVFGVGALAPGQMQGPTPVIVPQKPQTNFSLSNTNNNLNDIFSAWNTLK